MAECPLGDPSAMFSALSLYKNALLKLQHHVFMTSVSTAMHMQMSICVGSHCLVEVMNVFKRTK